MVTQPIKQNSGSVVTISEPIFLKYKELRFHNAALNEAGIEALGVTHCMQMVCVSTQVSQAVGTGGAIS